VGVVVEPGYMATEDPKSMIRYRAPELLDLLRSHLPDCVPSKESDIYSLAMTTYEVRPSRTVHSHP